MDKLRKSKYFVIPIAVLFGIVLMTAIFMEACVPANNVNDSNANAEDEVAAQNGDTNSDDAVHADTGAEEYEDAGSHYVANNSCKNDKILTYNYGKGKISVGTDKVGNSDFIYLNIKASVADKGNEIGYYLESSRVNLQYYANTGAEYSQGSNANSSNFIILDRLYDNVISSEFKDFDNYGARWADDKLADGKTAGTTITIRAVNLRSGKILCICDAKIGYNEDKETYELVSIKSGDVSANKELTEKERTDIVDQAVDFVRDNEDINDSSTLEQMRANAIVDEHVHTYFPEFLDLNGDTEKMINYSFCKNTYAVTIPLDLYGLITVYFAPRTQTIGMTSTSAPDSDDMHLTMYGYDPLVPQSKETLIAPYDFWN